MNDFFDFFLKTLNIFIEVTIGYICDENFQFANIVAQFPNLTLNLVIATVFMLDTHNAAVIFDPSLITAAPSSRTFFFSDCTPKILSHSSKKSHYCWSPNPFFVILSIVLYLPNTPIGVVAVTKPAIPLLGFHTSTLLGWLGRPSRRTRRLGSPHLPNSCGAPCARRGLFEVPFERAPERNEFHSRAAEGLVRSSRSVGAAQVRPAHSRCLPRQLHNFLRCLPQVIGDFELQARLRQEFAPFFRIRALQPDHQWH